MLKVLLSACFNKLHCLHWSSCRGGNEATTISGASLQVIKCCCVLQSRAPVAWNSLLVIGNVPDTPSGSSEVEKLVRRFGTVIKTLVLSSMVRAMRLCSCAPLCSPGLALSCSALKTCESIHLEECCKDWHRTQLYSIKQVFARVLQTYTLWMQFANKLVCLCGWE